MWIFDEKWWPSQGVAGKVPPRYAAKRLAAAAVTVEGPCAWTGEGYAGERYIAAVAGRVTDDGRIDAASLVDLAPFIRDGKAAWPAPAGRWRVMRFTHEQAPGLGQGGGRQLSVDGASRDCVAWFIETVYQPHYERFKADFGKTIPGFFYDEPETRGDWGTELNGVLAAWGVDWKLAYVAQRFELAGEVQAAARYQYREALAEAWGRTMYGGMSEWCRARGVISMGHFMEHGYLYLHPDFCGGDMMRLQKYSDMGGIDLVCQQMYPGQRPHNMYQTPKLGSSITHVYNKPDDVTMCEMFGAYGQDITYSQMKWLTDQMQVRGVNFMIPHSFNPRAPHDTDCPPYFFNGGQEPRRPLYRVYADYTSRLSLLLSGGRHVCPVALLFTGNAKQVGKMITPEDFTSALQDAQYDCDWLPCEAFEAQAVLDGRDVRLHAERYQVLVVPPAEVIPYPTLAKAKAFFDQGGVVVGYGFQPSRSATVGKTAADIQALCAGIWGARTNAAGGRALMLPEKPTAAEITQALAKTAAVPPVVEVLEGDTGGWLHVLHRVKDGRDVFFICNQNHEGVARTFRLALRTSGKPACWDAMRNEITAVPQRTVDGRVEVTLTLEPSESVLLVTQLADVPRRARFEAAVARPAAPLVREAAAAPAVATNTAADAASAEGGVKLEGCAWMWYPEGNPLAAAPPGKRYFRRSVTLPADRHVRQAWFTLSADNDFELFVNGQAAGRSDGGENAWQRPQRLDVTALLKAGANMLAVSAVNTTDEPSPAGLLGRLVIAYDAGKPLTLAVDDSWQTAREVETGWQNGGGAPAAWSPAKIVARYGEGPWGKLGGRSRRLTVSPIAAADPFVGQGVLPADLDPARTRVYLVMEGLAPEEAARVTVNGRYAGGFIGRPLRLDVTAHVRPGANRIVIEPFAPKAASLVWE